MTKVFVSHSTRDREYIEEHIIVPLKSLGIDTWYSTDDIKTSEAWERSIKDGLKGCDWFLVVMSPRSVDSKWVRREVHWAIERKEGRIIPVLIEECDPADLHLGLFPIQHIDFSHDVEKAQMELFNTLGLSTRNTGTESTKSEIQSRVQNSSEVRTPLPSASPPLNVKELVLNLLSAEGRPMTLPDIARSLGSGVTRADLTTALSELQKLGFIQGILENKYTNFKYKLSSNKVLTEGDA